MSKVNYLLSFLLVGCLCGGAFSGGDHSNDPPATQSPFVGVYDVQPNAQLRCNRTYCICCPVGRLTITQQGPGDHTDAVVRFAYATAPNECMNQTTEVISATLTRTQTAATSLVVIGPAMTGNRQQLTLSTDRNTILVNDQTASYCSNTFRRTSAGSGGQSVGVFFHLSSFSICAFLLAVKVLL